MLIPYLRQMIGRLPFAKEIYGQYLAREAFAKVSNGTTAMNVLETFPAFVANGWGLYQPRARLTIQSINQTIPALLSIGNSRVTGEQAKETIERFARGNDSFANADRLKTLLDRHGSDKASRHDYYQAYAHILGDGQRVRKILEIGLGTNNTDVVSTMGRGGCPGASLRAFRDFCPNAVVYGADFDRRILFEEERIQTVFVDQTDPQTFQAVGDKAGSDFDLMIDDGLHAPNANLHSLAFFLPRLCVGGWAVVEDIAPQSEAIWRVAALLLPSGYESHLLRGRSAMLFLVRRIA